MTTGDNIHKLNVSSDGDGKAGDRRMVFKMIGMTAGFFLFLLFLGMACYTTTMDVNNNVHVNWWLMGIAFFWAGVFMYHAGIS
ncbi:hypothetical protein [Tanticharoenia sakaeratensis]|jgi:hypothetical protein|uniref:Uncharacterized protein n=1 Tax=Tanticharoenia sakaeratensis NBRC 103193 TaxID=1231623 RepID=A0A0D6MMW9_9PROT|nr:hypothetical protein [Tanticharoenia sakaeratensis]GAN54643.1 hypothetical protein Tasa_028_010 [Tanticharoenia sakaeratensis NBRC 103193]GBQ16698.1 hypothetical protein AA103193_0074 [Tanticharoenia sakaeratensis NBRC 103193]